MSEALAAFLHGMAVATALAITSDLYVDMFRAARRDTDTPPRHAKKGLS